MWARVHRILYAHRIFNHCTPMVVEDFFQLISLIIIEVKFRLRTNKPL